MTDTNDAQPSPLQTPEAAPQSNTPHRKHFFRSKFLFVILILIFLTSGGLTWYLATNKTAQTALNTLGKLPQIKEVLEQTAKITTSPGKVIRHTPTTPLPSQQSAQVGSGEPQQSGQHTEQNPQDSPVPQWSTYQNSSYKFSIDFPSQYQLKEKNEGFGVTHVAITNPASGFPDVPDFQILIFPKSVGKLINEDFDAKYALSDNSSTMIVDEAGTSKFTKVRNRTVGSQRALDYMLATEPSDPQEEPEVGVYIEAGSNVIIISTYASEKATLESMLTSFTYAP